MDDSAKELLQDMANSFEGWMSEGLHHHQDYYDLPDADIREIAHAIINEDESTIDPDYDFRWQARAWLIMNVEEG